MTTKRITYVAMLTTVSVIVVVILSSLTPILAFPTLRIAFEGVLVKLTGYLFGPITGLLTGAVTELLVTLLRPSYLHWGYTLAIVLYGLFGGLAYYVKQQKLYQVLISNILIFVIMLSALGAGIALIYVLPDDTIRIFSNFYVPKWFAIVMLASSTLFASCFVIGIPLYLRLRGFKNELVDILPILLLAVLTEYFVSIAIIPIADSQTLKLPYLVVFVPRLLLAPFDILGNTFVIYTVYKLLGPIISPDDSRRFGSRSLSFWFSAKNYKIHKVNALVKDKIFTRFSDKDNNSVKKLQPLLKKYQINFDRNKVICITGTNGKSALALYLEKLLASNDKYVVGVYTSPHLNNWTERIRVSERCIDELDFKKYYDVIATDIIDSDLNFFEIFTLVALLHFKEKKVDYVILECGIGARYDACNAVNHAYSAITSVSLDHTKILGPTHFDIATEKSYIMQQNSTAYINTSVQEIEEVFLNRAQEFNVRLHNCATQISNVKIDSKGNTTFTYNNKKWQLPFANLALAEVACMAICIANKLGFSLEKIALVLATFVLPVRLQKINKHYGSIILDAAHNPAAITNLVNSVKQITSFDKVLVFYASLNTKDYKTNWKILRKNFPHSYFTSFDSPKAVRLVDIPNCKSTAPNCWKIFYRNYKKYDYIIFTGSFYFLEEVINKLNL